MTASLLAVALTGALGAVVRHLLERAHARARERSARTTRPVFPWATLVVNVLGSALLGWVVARLADGRIDDVWAAALGAGFAGALTTYSTFSLDLVLLVRSRAFGLASSYLGASLLLGLLAAAGGVALGGGSWR